MVAQLEVQSRKEDIRNSVTKDQQTQVDNFVTQLEKAQKEKNLLNKDLKYDTESVINIFDKNATTILESIQKNIKTKMDDVTILTFMAAIDAFDKDLNEYSSKKGGEKLLDESTLVQMLRKDITDKQTKITTEKNTEEIVKKTLNAPINQTSAIKLFEGDKTMFDLVMASLCKEGKVLDITNTEEKNELYDRLEAYIGKETMKNVTDIKLGKSNQNYGNRFPEGNRVITYKQKDKEKSLNKSIVQGNYDNLQKLVAEREKNFTGELERNKEGVKALNNFDDIGNYRSFNTYITKKGPEYVRDNLANIIAGINDYQPQSGKIDFEDGRINDLKNGYANIFTDYIVTNPTLLEEYSKHLTVENINLNILGADKATRIANYNKLVPALKSIRDKFDPTEQKKLIELGSIIGAQEKMNPQEMISKGLDGLLNSFGPMLFSILKFLGVNKKSLIKMFPGSKDKINEIFAKEYGLSEDQITAINDISQNKEFSTEGDKLLTTGSEMKDEFKDKKNEYLGLIAEDTNGKLINVNVFQKGLSLYNKDQNTSLNINDIVTIETDPKTKKQSITKINDIDKFKLVIQSIVEDKAVRSKIAAAHEELETEGKEKGYNAQGMDLDTAKNYGIRNQQDIARYLTASLFSNKDLSYVMTENHLNNGKKIEINKTLKVEYKIKEDDVNFRNAKDIEKRDLLKKDTEVNAVIEKNTEVILKGSEIGLKDEDKKDLLFVKVQIIINGEKVEGWIAKDYLKDRNEKLEETEKPAK